MTNAATTAWSLRDEAGIISLGGMIVNRLGFGAMRNTGPGVWGDPEDVGAAKTLLQRAVELGVNFIDTADAYGPETNEQLIAAALSPYPDDLVIGTKGGLLRTGPGEWTPDGRPEHLREACDGSLLRLGLDQIDLYQLHTPDPDVPFAESVGALAELQAAGKIRHVGLCNVMVEQLAQARKIVDVVSVQNRYGVGERYNEGVLAACEESGIAFIPWFPLQAGVMAKPGGPLAEVAHAANVEPAQVAIAWLLQHSPATLPIPGTSSIDHLDENIVGAAIYLTETEVAALDQIAAPS